MTFLADMSVKPLSAMKMQDFVWRGKIAQGGRTKISTSLGTCPLSEGGGFSYKKTFITKGVFFLG